MVTSSGHAGADLIHVGLPKSASTWLQSVAFPVLEQGAFVPVRSRGGVALSSLLYRDAYRRGELSGICDSQRRVVGRRLVLSREGFSFLGRRVPGRPQVGLETAATRLHAELPGASILFIVRNQGEMLRSVYSQYIHRGGTLAIDEWMRSDSTTYRFDEQQYRYDLTVDIFTQLFSNVVIIPFELLRSDAATFLSCLAVALGRVAGDSIVPTAGRKNASLSPAGLALLRRWNRLLRRTMENPYPLLALPLPGRHRRLFQHADPVFRFLPSREYAQIIDRSKSFSRRFAQSNRRLQTLVLADLASLGYTI